MINMQGKNVLVTGATGLLGRPLVDKLIQRGARVIATGYEPMPREWSTSSSFSYLSCDLSSDYGVEDMLTEARDEAFPDEIDCIFHLSGAKGGVGIGRTRAADFMNANLNSTIALLKELVAVNQFGDPPSKLPRLLFTSSVGAYPGDRNVFVEDWIEAGPPHASDYFGGYAKRFGEILCKAYREQYGLDYVVVRPTNCYGPYDRFDPATGMVIAALIARLEAGEWPLNIWGDGSQRRDFLYSKDCAEGMIRAMEHGESGEAYNLGTGVALPLRAVISALAEKYPNLTFKSDSSKPTGPAERIMDMTKSFRVLGTFLRYDAVSGLHHGISETVDWYRANKDFQKYDPFKK